MKSSFDSVVYVNGKVTCTGWAAPEKAGDKVCLLVRKENKTILDTQITRCRRADVGEVVYKDKVKVAVKSGEPAFKAAAEKLRNMQPLNPFQLCEEIAVSVPEEEDKMKNAKVFNELVEEKKKTANIDAYYKDLIKDPYTSVLLMVVDDNGKNSGKKSNVILGNEYTKMAVTNRRVKKTFCAYFTFAK